MMTNTNRPAVRDAFDRAWYEQTGQTPAARAKVWRARDIENLQRLVRERGTTRYGRALRSLGGSI